MNHINFIVAAYLVAAVLLGGLIALTVFDYRRQKALLAERGSPDGDERS